MRINWLLQSPHGQMRLQAESRRSMGRFVVVTVSPQGRTTKPVPIDLHSAIKDADVKLPTAVIKKWEEKLKAGNNALIRDLTPVSK